MDKKEYIKCSYPVQGMSCAACAARIDKILNNCPGVLKADVNFASETAYIEYDPDLCSSSSLKIAVQNAGYDLLTGEGNDVLKNQEKEYNKLKRRTIWAIALSIPILLGSMIFMNVPYIKYGMWILSTPVIFGLGKTFFINAWKQLLHHSANMDTLVAASTGTAYLFSVFNLFFPDFWLSRGIAPHIYFEASSVIISFILLGRLLEERAKKQMSSAIQKLIGLQPQTVCILTESGNESIISIKDIRIGDTVVVKPGERIAVDGTVTKGDSYVDESTLNGEPIPVYKETGKKVFAGTINQKGVFYFKADKVGSDTLLAQIIRMVQDAQGSKAPVQKLVNKIAGIFVPIIICVSLITFIIWLIFDPQNGFTHGLLALVTILIIACPCALGLATPTAIMVGIAKGAEKGILIKNAESLEIAKQIDTIILDKTGTITQGNPIVVDMLWHIDTPLKRSILYSMEKLSEHPLSEAIVHVLNEVPSIEIDHFNSIPGKGICGTIAETTYYAGNSYLLQEHYIIPHPELQKRANQWIQEGKTIIWFFDNEQIIAVIAITDEIKKTSQQAISHLQKLGIDVYMLTGDHLLSAKHIAEKLGIDYYKSGVLPNEKALFVHQLQQKGKKVAMVGDGINDSAALAQADLSIAMGQGSDIAIDVAMVTILSSDLLKIPEMICLSQLTVKTIHQNLFWAFIYNLFSIPIAAGILFPINGFLLNPMFGGAAMALSSVSVVFNSLLLKRKNIDRFLQKKIGVKHPINQNNMKKEFKIEGMMCEHCRTRVERVLNDIPGVQATVTLTPPVVVISFSQKEIDLKTLQKIILEKAGSYQLSPKK